MEFVHLNRCSSGEARGTLHIRVARIKERVGFVLLLRAEDPAFELAKLRILGLGARPTEVLYWLAKGKTNKEIGMILSMATETVKAHLKDVYSRLAIENRATAAVMISELLVGAKSRRTECLETHVWE